MKINRIRASMNATFSFFIENVYNLYIVLSFNVTPNFVTWRSRQATAPDTPTCIVIYSGQFTGGVHSSNQFVPEIVSPLPCSSALVCHTLLFVYFFKKLISFIFPLTNATPAFSTLEFHKSLIS